MTQQQLDAIWKIHTSQHDTGMSFHCTTTEDGIDQINSSGDCWERKAGATVWEIVPTIPTNGI